MAAVVVAFVQGVQKRMATGERDALAASYLALLDAVAVVVPCESD